MTDTFDALPEEKRKSIINAAMNVFATHGYRKASASDIAKEAGISKAMVFTYFGSKYRLYEYLSNLTIKVSLSTFEAAKPKLLDVADYFERILLAGRIKIEMMKSHPFILEFSTAMFVERDPKVKPILDDLFAKVLSIRVHLMNTEIEKEKFKNPDDIERISRMTEWMAAGVAEEWKGKSPDDLDDVMEIFGECLTALKKHYYKEKYL